MIRAVGAVVGGLVTWVVVASVGNRLLRIALPGYAEVEVAMTFTQAMLVDRLVLGAASSLCAGFVGALIAKRNGIADKVLAGILLVAFIPVHYSLWERFPAWYHLVFLASLVVYPSRRGHSSDDGARERGPGGLTR